MEIIDPLRGIAALCVLWFHLSGFKFWSSQWFARSGAYGWLGVQAFFVISGFILPFSLHRTGYRVKLLGTFIIKRVLRLDPPYLVTLAVIVCYSLLAARSGLHQGGAVDLSLARIAAHLAYANAFVGLPWLSDSFWTLAIEFEYYVVLGLLFPLLCDRRLQTAVILVLAIAVVAYALPQNAHFPHHAPVFLFGITIFRYKALRVGFAQLWLGLVSATILTIIFDGVPQTLAALLVACLILFARFHHRVFKWMGEISYSLYLTHGFVIIVIVTQGVRFAKGARGGQVMVAISAVVFSILIAVALNKFVERPAKELSHRLRYKPDIMPSSVFSACQRPDEAKQSLLGPTAPNK